MMMMGDQKSTKSKASSSMKTKSNTSGRTSPGLNVKRFTIPKKQKDLLNEIELDSSEYLREVLPIIQQGYRDSASKNKFVYNKVQLVHNAALKKEFMNKKREMKDGGRNDKELVESFAFFFVKREETAKKLCSESLMASMNDAHRSKVHCLGNPSMGVHVCRYSDILQRYGAPKEGILLLVKIMKGKVKAVPVVYGADGILEPTPNYDCHVAKNSGEEQPGSKLFDTSQLYVYDFDEEEVEFRTTPRNICPYAVVHFTYSDTGVASTASASTFNRKPVVSSGESTPTRNISIPETVGLAVVAPCYPRDDIVTERPKGDKDRPFASKYAEYSERTHRVWSGHLHNKNGNSCRVCLMSYGLAFLPCHVPEELNQLKAVRIKELKLPTKVFTGSVPALSRVKEAQANGKFYWYAELRSLSLEDAVFTRFLNYLTDRDLVLKKILKEDSLLMYIMPTGRTTQKLGLTTGSHPRIMHCLIESYVPVISNLTDVTVKQPKHQVKLNLETAPIHDIDKDHMKRLRFQASLAKLFYEQNCELKLAGVKGDEEMEPQAIIRRNSSLEEPEESVSAQALPVAQMTNSPDSDASEDKSLIPDSPASPDAPVDQHAVMWASVSSQKVDQQENNNQKADPHLGPGPRARHGSDPRSEHPAGIREPRGGPHAKSSREHPKPPSREYHPSPSRTEQPQGQRQRQLDHQSSYQWSETQPGSSRDGRHPKSLLSNSRDHPSPQPRDWRGGNEWDGNQQRGQQYHEPRPPAPHRTEQKHPDSAIYERRSSTERLGHLPRPSPSPSHPAARAEPLMGSPHPNPSPSRTVPRADQHMGSPHPTPSPSRPVPRADQHMRSPHPTPSPSRPAPRADQHMRSPHPTPSPSRPAPRTDQHMPSPHPTPSPSRPIPRTDLPMQSPRDGHTQSALRAAEQRLDPPDKVGHKRQSNSDWSEQESRPKQPPFFHTEERKLQPAPERELPANLKEAVSKVHNMLTSGIDLGIGAPGGSSNRSRGSVPASSQPTETDDEKIARMRATLQSLVEEREKLVRNNADKNNASATSAGSSSQESTSKFKDPPSDRTMATVLERKPTDGQAEAKGNDNEMGREGGGRNDVGEKGKGEKAGVERREKVGGVCAEGESGKVVEKGVSKERQAGVMEGKEKVRDAKKDGESEEAHQQGDSDKKATGEATQGREKVHGGHGNRKGGQIVDQAEEKKKGEIVQEGEKNITSESKKDGQMVDQTEKEKTTLTHGPARQEEKGNREKSNVGSLKRKYDEVQLGNQKDGNAPQIEGSGKLAEQKESKKRKAEIEEGKENVSGVPQIIESKKLLDQTGSKKRKVETQEQKTLVGNVPQTLGSEKRLDQIESENAKVQQKEKEKIVAAPRAGDIVKLSEKKAGEEKEGKEKVGAVPQNVESGKGMNQSESKKRKADEPLDAEKKKLKIAPPDLQGETANIKVKTAMKSGSITGQEQGQDRTKTPANVPKLVTIKAIDTATINPKPTASEKQVDPKQTEEGLAKDASEMRRFLERRHDSGKDKRTLKGETINSVSEMRTFLDKKEKAPAGRPKKIKSASEMRQFLNQPLKKISSVREPLSGKSNGAEAASLTQPFKGKTTDELLQAGYDQDLPSGIAGQAFLSGHHHITWALEEGVRVSVSRQEAGSRHLLPSSVTSMRQRASEKEQEDEEEDEDGYLSVAAVLHGSVRSMNRVEVDSKTKAGMAYLIRQVIHRVKPVRKVNPRKVKEIPKSGDSQTSTSDPRQPRPPLTTNQGSHPTPDGKSGDNTGSKFKNQPQPKKPCPKVHKPCNHGIKKKMPPDSKKEAMNNYNNSNNKCDKKMKMTRAKEKSKTNVQNKREARQHATNRNGASEVCGPTKKPSLQLSKKKGKADQTHSREASSPTFSGDGIIAVREVTKNLTKEELHEVIKVFDVMTGQRQEPSHAEIKKVTGGESQGNTTEVVPESEAMDQHTNVGGSLEGSGETSKAAEEIMDTSNQTIDKAPPDDTTLEQSAGGDDVLTGRQVRQTSEEKGDRLTEVISRLRESLGQKTAREVAPPPAQNDGDSFETVGSTSLEKINQDTSLKVDRPSEQCKEATSVQLSDSTKPCDRKVVTSPSEELASQPTDVDEWEDTLPYPLEDDEVLEIAIEPGTFVSESTKEENIKEQKDCGAELLDNIHTHSAQTEELDRIDNLKAQKNYDEGCHLEIQKKPDKVSNLQAQKDPDKGFHLPKQKKLDNIQAQKEANKSFQLREQKEPDKMLNIQAQKEPAMSMLGSSRTNIVQTVEPVKEGNMKRQTEPATIIVDASQATIVQSDKPAKGETPLQPDNTPAVVKDDNEVDSLFKEPAIDGTYELDDEVWIELHDSERWSELDESNQTDPSKNHPSDGGKVDNIKSQGIQFDNKKAQSDHQSTLKIDTSAYHSKKVTGILKTAKGQSSESAVTTQPKTLKTSVKIQSEGQAKTLNFILPKRENGQPNSKALSVSTPSEPTNTAKTQKKVSTFDLLFALKTEVKTTTLEPKSKKAGRVSAFDRLSAKKESQPSSPKGKEQLQVTKVARSVSVGGIKKKKASPNLSSAATLDQVSSDDSPVEASRLVRKVVIKSTNMDQSKAEVKSKVCKVPQEKRPAERTKGESSSRDRRSDESRDLEGGKSRRMVKSRSKDTVTREQTRYEYKREKNKRPDKRHESKKHRESKVSVKTKEDSDWVRHEILKTIHSTAPKEDKYCVTSMYERKVKEKISSRQEQTSSHDRRHTKRPRTEADEDSNRGWDKYRVVSSKEKKSKVDEDSSRRKPSCLERLERAWFPGSRKGEKIKDKESQDRWSDSRSRSSSRTSQSRSRSNTPLELIAGSELAPGKMSSDQVVRVPSRASSERSVRSVRSSSRQSVSRNTPQPEYKPPIENSISSITNARLPEDSKPLQTQNAYQIESLTGISRETHFIPISPVESYSESPLRVPQVTPLAPDQMFVQEVECVNFHSERLLVNQLPVSQQGPVTSEPINDDWRGKSSHQLKEGSSIDDQREESNLPKEKNTLKASTSRRLLHDNRYHPYDRREKRYQGYCHNISRPDLTNIISEELSQDMFRNRGLGDLSSQGPSQREAFFDQPRLSPARFKSLHNVSHDESMIETSQEVELTYSGSDPPKGLAEERSEEVQRLDQQIDSLAASGGGIHDYFHIDASVYLVKNNDDSALPGGSSNEKASMRPRRGMRGLRGSHHRHSSRPPPPPRQWSPSPSHHAPYHYHHGPPHHPHGPPHGPPHHHRSFSAPGYWGAPSRPVTSRYSYSRKGY